MYVLLNLFIFNIFSPNDCFWKKCCVIHNIFSLSTNIVLLKLFFHPRYFYPKCFHQIFFAQYLLTENVFYSIGFYPTCFHPMFFYPTINHIWKWTHSVWIDFWVKTLRPKVKNTKIQAREVVRQTYCLEDKVQTMAAVMRATELAPVIFQLLWTKLCSGVGFLNSKIA